MWLCDYVAVAVWLWLWLCREQPGALLCGFLTCWRLQVRDLPASGVPSGHRAVAIVRVPQPAVRVRRQQPSVRGDCVLACRGLLRCADRGLRVVAPATWTCSLSPTSAWDETRRRFRWVLAHCVCACACVCACVCSYSFGCCVYEMVSGGKSPWEHLSPYEAAMKVIGGASPASLLSAGTTGRVAV